MCVLVQHYARCFTGLRPSSKAELQQVFAGIRGSTCCPATEAAAIEIARSALRSSHTVQACRRCVVSGKAAEHTRVEDVRVRTRRHVYLSLSSFVLTVHLSTAWTIQSGRVGHAKLACRLVSCAAYNAAAVLRRSPVGSCMAVLLRQFSNFAMFALRDLPRSSFLSATVPLVARPLCSVPPLRTTRCYATGVSS